MNTTLKFATGLVMGGLLAAAGTAAAQIVSVQTPPPGTAGPTDVHAGPVNVDTTPGGTSVNLFPRLGGGLTIDVPNRNAPVLPGNRPAPRDWRMVYHNHQWWYWHPSGTWSVYRNGAWQPYHATVGSTAPSAGGSAKPSAVGDDPARGGADTQGTIGWRGPFGLSEPVRPIPGWRGPGPAPLWGTNLAPPPLQVPEGRQAAP